MLTISIPAPARGRTGNPMPESHGEWIISIPAPARGRTSLPSGTAPASLFQFPPPRGGERGAGKPAPTHKGFQFPPPRGGERLWPGSCGQRRDFNSRPREGANTCARGVTCDEGKFQFPPPRGGERRGRRHGTARLYFNSRPREGANSKTAQNRAVYLVSLLKFGRISAILPYILSATRAKKRETPKIIGFLLRRPTGRSCMEQVGAGGVR